MIKNPDQEKLNEPMSKEQAETEIGAILQYMSTMGALSSEPGDIQKIIDQLHEGTVEPDKAVEMARKIESSRQENYH